MKFIPEAGQWFIPVENGRTYTLHGVKLTTCKGKALTRDGRSLCTGITSTKTDILATDERTLLEKEKPNRIFKITAFDFMPVECNGK